MMNSASPSTGQAVMPDGISIGYTLHAVEASPVSVLMPPGNRDLRGLGIEARHQIKLNARRL
jgi:hypothetical protein